MLIVSILGTIRLLPGSKHTTSPWSNSFAMSLRSVLSLTQQLRFSVLVLVLSLHPQTLCRVCVLCVSVCLRLRAYQSPRSIASMRYHSARGATWSSEASLDPAGEGFRGEVGTTSLSHLAHGVHRTCAYIYIYIYIRYPPPHGSTLL